MVESFGVSLLAYWISFTIIWLLLFGVFLCLLLSNIAPVACLVWPILFGVLFGIGCALVLHLFLIGCLVLVVSLYFSFLHCLMLLFCFCLVTIIESRLLSVQVCRLRIAL